MGTDLGTVDVIIQPFGLRERAERGQTLYEAIREAGIELNSICGGLGRCGKCRVVVTKGRAAINKPTEAEQEHLSTQELSSACMHACIVSEDGKRRRVTVIIAPIKLVEFEDGSLGVSFACSRGAFCHDPHCRYSKTAKESN